ncbi:MAG: hypothetical protein GY849_14165, partial [Deltaproteobacteria bacterium]|nr:hypothetical protein [Deltaproteobacteria bacterium]
PQVPEGLIWSSSDYAALIDSKDLVMNAIAEFSEKYDLPIYYFGYLDNDITSRLKSPVDLGMVSFWHHKALLASLPPLIGVAPLETTCPKEDLDFINAKSDVKMVEFGGFGHPSVYSSAPPFKDTDLKCGVLVENEEKAWFDGLELMYREGWRHLDSEQAEIIQRRHMSKIAAECWHEAISRARLNKPLIGKDIKTSDIKQPEEELAEVLNSRSWKITAPLRYGFTLLQR